jgi:hypothetical protein
MRAAVAFALIGGGSCWAVSQLIPLDATKEKKAVILYAGCLGLALIGISFHLWNAFTILRSRLRIDEERLTLCTAEGVESLSRIGLRCLVECEDAQGERTEYDAAQLLVLGERRLGMLRFGKLGRRLSGHLVRIEAPLDHLLPNAFRPQSLKIDESIEGGLVALSC